MTENKETQPTKIKAVGEITGEVVNTGEKKVIPFSGIAIIDEKTLSQGASGVSRPLHIHELGRGLTVCLNMIVKNESKIIARMLDSVVKYLDYWVIADTGSTDGTQDIIRNYFKEKEIPGELVEFEFKNFGYARSRSIKHAIGKADYILLLDADHTFTVKDPNWKKFPFTEDCYLIRNDGGLDYRESRFVRGNINWYYRCVTHEYLASEKHTNRQSFDGFSVNHVGDGGSKSDKFERDIRLITEALKDPEEKDNYVRYYFYLAQSYKYLSRWDEAIEWYTKRAEAGSFWEEAYYAQYMVGMCKKWRGDDFFVWMGDCLKAFNMCKDRLEALFEIVAHCRDKSMHQLGAAVGCMALGNKYPHHHILFIEKEIHEWRFWDALSTCCFYASGYREVGKRLAQKIIHEKLFPEGERKRLEQNLWFFSLENRRAVDAPRLPPLNVDVIVSITTVPSRLELLAKTLTSLQMQTLRARRICLCVPAFSRRERCAYPLAQYKDRFPFIDIVGTEDFGSATKLLPILVASLEKKNPLGIKPSTMVATADDDIEYDSEWLERLVRRSLQYPKDAICFSAWDARELVKGGHYIYHSEEHNKDFGESRLADVVEGYRGVLYKPQFFYEKSGKLGNLLNFTGIPEAMYADDIWFSGHLAANGVKRRVVRFLDHRVLTHYEVWNKVWRQNGMDKEANPLHLDSDSGERNRRVCREIEKRFHATWKISDSS